MKSYRYTNLTFIILVLLILTLSACSSGSDDGFGQFSLQGTNISMSDIAGSWNATTAFFSRSADGPVLDIDIVEIGGTLTLVIETSGRFSVTIDIPNEFSETNTGKFAFDEELLVISFDEDPGEWEYFAISHQEPNLTIEGGTVYEAYDFDGDGIRDDSNIYFELNRIN